MMFVDASAFVAVLTDEPEKREFEDKLLHANSSIASPMAVYEAVLAMQRKTGSPLGVSRRDIVRFMAMMRIGVVPITESIGNVALDAFETFGRGRHRAALNMGDCFAYACAKVHKVPLLCKGDDFTHTDITIA